MSLRPARISAATALLIKIEPRPEDLERLPVIQATADSRPEDRRERVPRNSQPVRPGSVLPGLIHQALTDIEDHSPDHDTTLDDLDRPLGVIVKRSLVRLSHWACYNFLYGFKGARLRLPPARPSPCANRDLRARSTEDRVREMRRVHDHLD